MIKPGLLDMNTLTTRLAEIKEQKGTSFWVERVVVTDQFTVTAICMPPGYPNDHHYHIYDECWIIAEGELSWQYEHSPEPRVVKAGDIVFAPKNLWHHIEVLGDKPAIRVAVSVTGEGHRYDRPGCKPVQR
jgi:quercetin dioxygenase-like cupin family protein